MEENDGLHTIFERSSRASNTFQDSTIPPSNVRAYKSAMRKPAASSPISQTQYAKISILVGDPNCTTSRVSIWPDPINLLALTASGIPSVTPLRVLLQVRSLLVVCVLFFGFNFELFCDMFCGLSWGLIKFMRECEIYPPFGSSESIFHSFSSLGYIVSSISFRELWKIGVILIHLMNWVKIFLV